MNTRWVKLTVAYDGTAYAGWQIQPDRPTVQGVVERAWQEITQEHVRVTAAGRTDSGVHALGQVVGVVTDSRLLNDDLLRGLNAVLPEDVAVLSVETAREGFHATHDAIAKRYRYQIHNGRIPPVFDRRIIPAGGLPGMVTRCAQCMRPSSRLASRARGLNRHAVGAP